MGKISTESTLPVTIQYSSGGRYCESPLPTLPVPPLPSSLLVGPPASFPGCDSLDGCEVEPAPLDGYEVEPASVDGCEVEPASLDGCEVDPESLDGCEVDPCAPPGCVVVATVPLSAPELDCVVSPPICDLHLNQKYLMS